MIIRIAVLLLGFLLQLSFRQEMLFFSIIPDIIILAIVLTVKKNSIIDGVLVGAGCGLLFDSLSSGIFGLGIFSLSLTGFLTAFLKKHVFSDNVFSKMLITFICTLVHSSIILFMLDIYYYPINIPGQILVSAIPTSVYTSVLLGVLVILYYMLIGKPRKAFG